MSNSDSFIEEVTEEVRRDRLFGLFRRYGWIAVLLVLGVVGGTAWTEWQKAAARDAARAFGDGMLQALEAETPEARTTAMAGLAATGDQSAVQRLMLATDPQQDRAGALTALQALAADTAVSQVYRDLATLRLVLLAGAEMTVSERRAALDPLTAPGRPFRPLALEQLAYLAVEDGDTAAAITQLRSLSQDQEAPAGLRRRAAQVIVALGGDTAQG